MWPGFWSPPDVETPRSSVTKEAHGAPAPLRVAHVGSQRLTESADAAPPQIDETGPRTSRAELPERQVRRIPFGDAAQVEGRVVVQSDAPRGFVQVDLARAHTCQQVAPLGVAQRARRPPDTARGPHQRLHRRIEGAPGRGSNVQRLAHHLEQLGRHDRVSRAVQPREVAFLPERHLVVHEAESREGAIESGCRLGEAGGPHLRRRPHHEAHLARVRGRRRGGRKRSREDEREDQKRYRSGRVGFEAQRRHRP